MHRLLYRKIFLMAGNDVIAFSLLLVACTGGYLRVLILEVHPSIVNFRLLCTIGLHIMIAIL